VLQLFLKGDGHDQSRRLIVDLEVKLLVGNDALALMPCIHQYLGLQQCLISRPNDFFRNLGLMVEVSLAKIQLLHMFDLHQI
jgi:hypothetical protein